MTHDPREALEPCPFCGGEAVRKHGYWIECGSCGAGVSAPKENISEDGATKRWNARALSTPSDAVNESAEARLREALERISNLQEQQPGLKALVSEMRATAIKALSAGGDEAKKSEGGLAPGCCSAASPCTYQKHDPTTICDKCKVAQTNGMPSDPPNRREIVQPRVIDNDRDEITATLRRGRCVG